MIEFKKTGSKSQFFKDYEHLYDKELLEAIWEFANDRYREGYRDGKDDEYIHEQIIHKYEGKC